jgi:predicted MFS family arabinose efflux permease
MTIVQESVPAARAAIPREGLFSRRYGYYVLVMLTLVSTLNFIDRQLMSILLEPIKAEFHLSDTQLGFLTGFAFAIFYSIMGIPLAKLADQGDRRKLITSVVIVWSAMTALCGVTVGFVSLMIARIGVGVGEAGSSPALQSQLADYFEPRRRASMIGVQSTGVYLGILLGFLLGGWINQYMGWRTAFMALGIPGVVFALVYWLTVREPPRGVIENVVDTGKAPPLLDTLRYFWSLRSYRHIPFAVSFYAFVAYGSMGWGPAFFMRTHHMTTGQIGTWLALSAGVAGGLGCYFGGVLSDYIVNRTGDARWHMWLPAIFIGTSIPLQFIVYLAPTPLPALLTMAVVWFLGNTWLGPAQSTLQALAGLRRRGMALAIMLFLNNLIGQGLGPQIVGILSDHMRRSYGPDSLRYSLLIAVVVASVLSVFHFAMAARSLRQDLRRNGNDNARVVLA